MFVDSLNPNSSTIAPDPVLNSESLLRALVADFDQSPIANGRRMRELLQLNADDFHRSAVKLLRGEPNRRGCRYLLTLLWTHEMLLPVLTDEALPIERALAAANTAAEVDPQLHIRITRYLIANTLEQQNIGESQSTRLLQILAAINDSVSLQPFVRQMLLHPSPRIRSKLSLLIGRSQSGNRSLATLLSDADSRVRANAVEALWHNANPEICDLVRLALQDSNNRVVGNAILGLYFAGSPFSISAAIKLTSHPDPVFRATAAWAMGKTGDPRFLRCLGRLLADSTGPLRKTVFGSISSIKQAAAARALAPPLHVEVLDVMQRPDGKTTVKAVVTSTDLAPLPLIPATGFGVDADGVWVTEYSSVVHTSDKLHLALAIPSDWVSENNPLLLDQAVQGCVRSKRVSDQWAIVKYADEESGPMSTMMLFGENLNAPSPDRDATARLAYTANPTVLNRTAEFKSSRFEDEPGLLTSFRSMIAAVPPGPAPRHLIAVIPYPGLMEAQIPDQLIQAARAGRFSIHVLCWEPSAEFFRVCRETHGFYKESESFESLQVDLETLCAGITNHYRLDFQQGEKDGVGLNALALEVYTTSAAGKAYWRRPDFAQQIQHPEVA